MKRTVYLAISSLLLVSPLSAAEVQRTTDVATGWDVYELRQGSTQIQVVPAAGANVMSLIHSGSEYFHQPSTLRQLPGVRAGNPILYPTPNRIRGAQFTFQGQTFRFPPGGNGNHIHGLVHSQLFSVESIRVTSTKATITCALRFAPGTKPYESFRRPHTFRMRISVEDSVVRWEYEVDNTSGTEAIPFGVALHPYIRYQDSRQQAYLHVPASHLMESFQQLPSGKLLDLEGHALDARKPVSLAGYQSDDVFLGMRPTAPASLAFRDSGRKITFRASPEFTHLVVWTPDRPYLGIENQTCSTDAHNLASQGKQDVAHLQVCAPGKRMTGSVAYHLE